MKFFLTLDGIYGGSGDPSFKGSFDVSGDTFGLTDPVGAFGKPSFQSLRLTLPTDTGLTSLLQDEATGYHISKATLKGVTDSGIVVYNLGLQDVVLRSLNEGSGSVSLSLDYSKISLTTQTQNPDGSLAPAQNFGYDVQANKEAGGSVSAAPLSTGSPVPVPTHYFMLVDGLNGGSTDPRHQGWFDINGQDFATTNASTAGAQNIPQFQDVSVSLGLISGATNFFRDAATGLQVKGVKIEGVTDAGQAVYDLTLGNVQFTSFLQSNSSSNLSLHYQQVGLTTHGVNSDGSLVAPTSFAFDRTTNTAIDPSQLPTPTAAPTASSVVLTPTKFFLTLDGIYGGSGDPSFKGSFDVSGDTFGLTDPVGAFGKPSFQSLRLTLPTDTGLTSLLQDEATGYHISKATLKGVTDSGIVVYNLGLQDVVLRSLNEGSGSVSLSLDYSKISLTTQTQNPDGSLAPAQNFGYDVQANKEAGGSVSAAPLSTGSPVPVPTHYFMLVDGLNGGSTDPRHQGWFDINGQDFATTNASTAGAQNIPQFQDVSVSLGLISGATNFFRDAATGLQVKGVKIEGVTDAGQAVYDLTLGNVQFTSFLQSNSSSNLSLHYQQVGLTTHGVNSDGSLVAPTSFAFDRTTNTAIDPSQLPTPTAAPTASSVVLTPTKFFLTLDGIYGGSGDPSFKGSFDVSGDTFGLTDPVGAFGKPSFQSLRLTLPTDTGLTSLLQDEATGYHISKATLKGVTDSGIVVYNLGLQDVVLRSLNEGSGSVSLSLDYSKISLTTQTQNPDGSLAPAQNFGYDVQANKEAGGSVSAAPLSTGSPVPVPTHYFMLVDGLNGGSTDPRHQGWFDINGQDFATTNASTAGAQNIPQFQDVSVSLGLISGATNFFRDAATGLQVKGVKIEGVTDAGQAVYDLTLGNVQFTSFLQSNSSSNLSLHYQQVGLTTHGVNSDGSLVAPTSFAFDRTTNTAIDPSQLPHINEFPFVVPETTQIISGGTVSGTAGIAGSGALAGDSDPDGDALTISAVAGGNVGVPVAGSYGHLTLKADGSYSYSSDSAAGIAAGPTGSHLQDIFSYSVSDGQGGTTSSSLNVTLDRAPLVSVATANTLVGGTVSGTAGISGSGALAGDSDPDSDALTISPIAGGAIGTSVAGNYGHLTLNADGSYSYAADNIAAIAAGFTGHVHDIFKYSVSDGQGGITSSSLNVTLDRTPLVSIATANIVVGGTASGTAGMAGSGALAGDSDPDGDALTISAISGGAIGTSVAGNYGHLTLSGDGSYSYAADNAAAIAAGSTGLHLHDVFNFSVSDGHGGITPSSVDIALDRGPVVGAETGIILAGHTLTGTAGITGSGGLAGDSDPDGDALTISPVAGNPIAGNFGHLTLNADGSYSYAADNAAAIAAGPTGPQLHDVFNYSVSDGHGGITASSLNITLVRSPDWDLGTHGTSWPIAGVGDFNADGTSDILWRSPGTGQVDEWQMDGGGWSRSIDLGATKPANWQLAGVGDFNGDGTSDLVWRDISNSQVDEWQMKNGNWSKSIDLGSTKGAGWQLAGVGDFNGDGTSDILWRKADTSHVDQWQMKNGNWAKSIDLGATKGSDWSLAGVGDFNGDGTTDVLWRNVSASQVDEWQMKNGNWSKSIDLGATKSADWQVAGIGDFNHDGTSDILWFNSKTGQEESWQMKNGNWAGSKDLGVQDPSWLPAGIGDFNHDGASDAIFLNPASGHLHEQLWLI